MTVEANTGGVQIACYSRLRQPSGPIGHVLQWQIGCRHSSVSPRNTVSNTIIAILKLIRVISNLITADVNSRRMGLSPREELDSSLDIMTSDGGRLTPDVTRVSVPDARAA